MNFWDELEKRRANWNVLEHPFYQRWSAGELSKEELALYAGEYHHAVVALAEASESTAQLAETPMLKEQLSHHAAEERSHVALWEQFTEAVGGVTAQTPTEKTKACMDAWSGSGQNRSMLESLVAMYAVESGQPEISKTKSKGLKEFYGFSAGPATEYFDLHAELDVEHAAAERKLIEERLDEKTDHGTLLKEAEKAWRANWQLLDGVEELIQSASEAG